MILDKNTAIKLELLLNPAVEEAIILLLNTAIYQKADVLDDINADINRLKAYQGQLALIKELKTYRQRILDAKKNG